MAQKVILSEKQIRILEIISQSKDICQSFYLTGGTALAEFYLQHRFSEDLDFFSEKEVDPQTIFAFLGCNQNHEMGNLVFVDATSGKPVLAFPTALLVRYSTAMMFTMGSSLNEKVEAVKKLTDVDICIAMSNILYRQPKTTRQLKTTKVQTEFETSRRKMIQTFKTISKTLLGT